MINNLDEAIAHAKEVAEEKRKLYEQACAYNLPSEVFCDCANEHEQLADWLTELKHLREVRALLKQKIADTDFDFGDYYDNTQVIINKIFDVIDKVYDEVLYDAKHSKENDNETDN